MTRPSTKRAGLSAFGGWLIACALALRIFVAPGLMPVADAGGVRLTLCTGSGPVELVVEGHGTTHRGERDPIGSVHEGCAFASLSAASLLSGAGPSLGGRSIVPFLQGAVALPSTRAPPVAEPPPATGPPALA